MRKILKSMRSNSDTFENVQPVLHAKVPIIRSRHRKLHIEIDISLHNMLVKIFSSFILINFHKDFI